MKVSWFLRLAVRLLPRDVRQEVLRELLEQHAEVRRRRGRFAARLWAARQPASAFLARDVRRRAAGSRGIRDDLLIAQRAITRRPALSLTVVATVAIAVGAIAAIVAIVDAVMWRSLPYPEAHQLVWISSYEVAPGTPPFDRARAAGAYSNPLDVVDWARRERHLTAITPFETFESTMQAADRPLRVDVASVRATVKDTLGIVPQHGRLFTDADYGDGVRVMLISHLLWQSAFASDVGLIGKRVPLGGEPFEVVGVLPPLSLMFPRSDTDVWLPLKPPAADFTNRGGVWQRVVARVDRGVPIEVAAADLERIGRELAKEYPDSNGRRHIAVVPFREGVIGATGSTLALLAGAVALVLLIACANVGHLLLVSAQGRRRELAVRAALGAEPWRLARLLFAESLWLAGAGGLAGVVLAPWLLRVFLQLYPDVLPAVGGVSIQVAALAAAAGATMLAAILAVVPSVIRLTAFGGRGQLPALRASERGSENRTERRVRATLVVTQVALSTSMLVAGGLLLRTFWAMRATDVGLAGGDVLTFNLALANPRYPTLADEVRFYDALLAQTRALPGVAAAGATTLLPLTPGEFGDGFYRIGFDDQYPRIPLARLQNVTPGYFAAIGLPLKAGRTLLDTDRPGSAGVVVVNEALQRQYFPDGALGRQIRFRGQIAEIVGIVGDKKHRSLREVSGPDMYFPRAQVAHPRYLGWVAVRVAGDPLALVPAVQRIVQDLDPGIALDDIDTMSNRIDQALALDRFRAFLVGALAAIALLLASLGLYGLIAHTVTRDARDLAIRMALGAGARGTVTRVLRGVLLLTGAGTLIGLGVAWAGRSMLRTFVAGVTSVDAGTIAVVALSSIATAMLAAAGPARRASRIDPASVLRAQ